MGIDPVHPITAPGAIFCIDSGMSFIKCRSSFFPAFTRVLDIDVSLDDR